MVFDAVYFIPFTNFKQWYTTNEKNKGKITLRLNTVILTKVKVKSINDVAPPDRASNKLSCDSIWFCTIYACDVTHDEILENTFSREELYYDEFILEG